MSITPPVTNIYTPPAPGHIRINGKDYPYTPPSTTKTTDGKWASTPAEGMGDLAKSVASQANNKMNGDMFLKLLVAQLKYQDPSKPMDTAAMMQQTASLAMVERMNEMATNVDNMVKATQSLAETQKEVGTSYVSMLMEQRMSSAVSLVGRTISYADLTNPETKIDGIVESVRFDKTGPILTVNGKDVPLTAVVSVKAPTAAPAPAPSPAQSPAPAPAPAPTDSTTQTPPAGSTDPAPSTDPAQPTG